MYDDYEEREKIMLVDDSPIMLRNLKSILEKKYITYLATSGKQALKAIPEKRPDLVLLDYKMPDLDGKEVFEAMQRDEYMKDIPVVFLTSEAESRTIYSILKLKPAGYILKPPDQVKIMETVEEILRGREISENADESDSMDDDDYE